MATSLIFQRGAGGSGQVSYWAGSSVGDKGGPVPAFTNPPQPAYVNLDSPGSHKIGYSANQPIASQTVFMKIIANDDKDNPVGIVSFTLSQGGTLSLISNTASEAGVVIKDEGDYFAIMIPPTL